MEGYCCFFLLFFFSAVSTRAWESNHILYTVRIKTAEYRTSTNRIVIRVKLSIDRGNSQEGCCYQHVKVCICRTSYHSTSSCLRFTLRRDAVFSMSRFVSGLHTTMVNCPCLRLRSNSEYILESSDCSIIIGIYRGG